MTTDIDIDLASATFEDVEATEQTPTRTRKPRSDKGQARGPRGRAASVKGLAEDLLVPYAMLASGLSFGAPTVAAVMMQRGEKTVDAFLAIAKEHPKMLTALKKASKMGPATELATTVVQIGIAAALDFGKLPPEHPMAVTMGITELYAMVHPPVDVETNGYVPTPSWSGVPVP